MALRAARSKTDVEQLGEVLISCLADEATARPETIRGAIRELVRIWSEINFRDFTELLARGKYGPDLLVELREAFFSPTPDLYHAALGLAETIWFQAVESNRPQDWHRTEEHFLDLLDSPTSRERCEGALGCMQLYYLSVQGSIRRNLAKWASASPLLARMLTATDVTEVFAASWAFAWLGECGVAPPPAEPDLLSRLFEIGWSHPEPEVRRMAWWALGSQPLAPRDDPRRFAGLSSDRLKDVGLSFEDSHYKEQIACLVVAWYKRAPWSDSELADKAASLLTILRSGHTGYKTFYELCRRLGVEAEPPESEEDGDDGQ